ncbi:MAG TPA: M24 family metallopeptidase [Thermomicrobiales bacterium]|nr:M24 family metallopeptidase [Thermomicrobiales bacterium]
MERDEERIGRLVAALAAADLDAVCCRLPQNVLLLTGYWPMLGNATALLTRAGDLALIVPADEQEFARRGWVAPEAIAPFTPVTLEHQGDTGEATRPLLAAAARRLGLAKAAVGYEGGAEFAPAPYVALYTGNTASLDLYRAVLPDAGFWDATDLLARERAALTPREVRCVHQACTLAAHGFRAAAAAIHPGATEAEIAAATHARIMADSLRSEGPRAAAHAFCMAGPRSADAYRAYALTDGRALAPGDFVLVHLNSCLDGFWTDLTRTYVLGEPDGRQLAMYEAVLEARGRALRAVRDGARGSEVDAAARDHLKAAGFGAAFKHQLGHGVGYGAIYHGNRPRLHPCSDDVLRTGMTFNVEPAVYIEGFGGLRHCDVAAAQAEQANLLSPFHASLDDLIIGSENEK